MFHTYIIQSESTHRYYIGSTADIEDRLKRHNLNYSLSTKHRGPWKLVYSRSHTTRSEAIHLEFQIKKRGAKRFLEDWVRK
jgi:putative endonuclease